MDHPFDRYSAKISKAYIKYGRIFLASTNKDITLCHEHVKPHHNIIDLPYLEPHNEWGIKDLDIINIYFIMYIT